MERPRRIFLTAQWRFLAMLNFRIDPAILRPYVPTGTELDTWRGDALVSVVGFRFVDTQVFGFAVPLHRDFDEVNLRFYVRRRLTGTERRGVTFVREIVPRRAIAAVARLLYNEPYVACPMHSLVPSARDAGAAHHVEYAWRFAARWHTIRLHTVGPPAALVPGTEEEFITEHFWGYTRQRDGSTIEYEVQHPPWNVWSVREASLDCDVARVYGPAFVDALSTPPCSAFLADGSAVTVGAPQRLVTFPTPASSTS